MWRELLDPLYPPPPSCVFCQMRHEEPGIPLCEPCRAALNLRPILFSCKESNCLALTIYTGLARNVLHTVKYQGGYDQACSLGIALGLALREQAIFQGAHWLLPVPLHEKRLQQRGFNQAEVLADSISKVWRRPVFRGAVRTRETVPQNQLSPRERWANLRMAFALTESGTIANRTVLIVDDIFTTGTTFGTLAEVVRTAGGIPMGAFVARGKESGYASQL